MYLFGPILGPPVEEMAQSVKDLLSVRSGVKQAHGMPWGCMNTTGTPVEQSQVSPA